MIRYNAENSREFWRRLFRSQARKTSSKYQPHQGAAEMARRRGETGWRVLG